jgi:hypothetical protein
MKIVQGKPKYSEKKKICPSATLSTTNPTWLDPPRWGSQRLTAWSMARPSLRTLLNKKYRAHFELSHHYSIVAWTIWLKAPRSVNRYFKTFDCWHDRWILRIWSVILNLKEYILNVLRQKEKHFHLCLQGRFNYRNGVTYYINAPRTDFSPNRPNFETRRSFVADKCGLGQVYMAFNIAKLFSVLSTLSKFRCLGSLRSTNNGHTLKKRNREGWVS